MRIVPLNHRPTGNRLLEKLASADLDRLMPHLETVPLGSRQVLAQADAAITHVYFVVSGLASVVTPLADGTMIEVGIIGAEGMVGVPVLLGAKSSPAEVMVQMPGWALRMEARELVDEVGQSATLQHTLLRFVQAFHVQVAQAAACNGRHTLNERLARWLLMAHDRTEGDELPLTHEFIATMLGVRRSGVTVALGALQSDGLISNPQNRVVVVDRHGLEAASCECYRTVQEQYELLLP